MTQTEPITWPYWIWPNPHPSISNPNVLYYLSPFGPLESWRAEEAIRDCFNFSHHLNQDDEVPLCVACCLSVQNLIAYLLSGALLPCSEAADAGGKCKSSLYLLLTQLSVNSAVVTLFLTSMGVEWIHTSCGRLRSLNDESGFRINQDRYPQW